MANQSFLDDHIELVLRCLILLLCNCLGEVLEEIQRVAVLEIDAAEDRPFDGHRPDCLRCSLKCNELHRFEGFETTLAAKGKQLAAQRTLRALLTLGQSPHECVNGVCHEIFSRLFARRDSNLNTALERQRLGRTMPGETAAIAGTRLGVLVG